MAAMRSSTDRTDSCGLMDSVDGATGLVQSSGDGTSTNGCAMPRAGSGTPHAKQKQPTCYLQCDAVTVRRATKERAAGTQRSVRTNGHPPQRHLCVQIYVHAIKAFMLLDCRSAPWGQSPHINTV